MSRVDRRGYGRRRRSEANTEKEREETERKIERRGRLLEDESGINVEREGK